MPEHLMSTDDFCTHYKVEYSFIDHDNLLNVERLVRMHYDLDINLEGIEAIIYLLNRVKTMQNEIIELKNRLYNYEGE